MVYIVYLFLIGWIILYFCWLFFLWFSVIEIQWVENPHLHRSGSISYDVEEEASSCRMIYNEGSSIPHKLIVDFIAEVEWGHDISRGSEKSTHVRILECFCLENISEIFSSCDVGNGLEGIHLL